MRETNLASMIHERTKTYGDRTAVRYKDGGAWKDTTWLDLGEHIDRAAAALLAVGVGELENVCIFAPNRPEWSVVDYAILSVRAVSVPIHATNTARQAKYILDETEARVVFVGSQAHYDRVLEFLPESRFVEHVIVFDPAVDLKSEPRSAFYSDFMTRGKSAELLEKVRARMERIESADLATIIYTSGTTGEPKGVMLPHSNFMLTFVAHDTRLAVSEADVSMCFLPLSHVFERTWSFYCADRGLTIVFPDHPANIVPCMQQTHPTVMCAVPRFYEKIYGTILHKLEHAPWYRKVLFRWSMAAGARASKLRRERRDLPLLPGIRHALARRLVLKKLQSITGGRIRMFPCAGAPLSQHIEEFFQAAGLNVVMGYGLTETTATVSCHETFHFRPGTVGTPIDGVEVRIGDGGEIQVRGATVMTGYYKKPDATAEVMTEDGWFRTGDAGVFEDGILVITDRIKDLMKTSCGKYVAPQLIETTLGNDHYIEQVSAIGDLRKYVTALIVPAFEALEAFAREHGITWISHEELIRKPEIVKFYEDRIALQQKDLADHEKVKRFRLLPLPFSQETGEITPTLKLRRKFIVEKYRTIIDALYAVD